VKNVEKVVQEQLDFYNGHDIEGFASTYHDEITIYDLVDNSVILEGKAALRDKYGDRFLNKELYARLVNRMVIGNKVIDHEEVSGIEENELVKAVAIYEVDEELITKVWFLFE
jgi:hypothetical protein